MTTYAEILIYAIPIFLVLIAIEWIFALSKKKKEIYNLFDTISSLSSGVTNIVKDVTGLSVVIISYEWFYEHLSLMEWQLSWITYFLAFIALDFAGYWSHRFEHQVNILWNRHIIHHSSEEFNLACALRQNISAIFVIFTFLLIPGAVLGVPPEVVAVVAPLHLFAQFWYHTRLINKMGFLEYIIVTPSHHRVHHAINDQYIDKNFGQIFIFWDKLFGTFQRELDETPPVYGVKKAVSSWNPIKINFQHLWLLINDAMRTKHFVEKATLWFKKTGYRPKDVSIRFPIETIKDVYAFEKYSTSHSPILKGWISFQFLVLIGLTLQFLSIVGLYEFTFILLFTLYLITFVYAYTSQMDLEKSAIIAEIIKCVIVSIVITSTNSWYNIHSSIMITYSVVSLGVSLMLIRYEYFATKAFNL